MKKSALKNRIKSYWGKHKTTFFVVALSLQLAIGLTIYFLFGRISPNDNIFVPREGSVAFLVNQNPKFSVDFGKVGEPDKQWVRFEAQTSAKNPFEEEKGNIFRKIAKLFQKKERYGIEMSLVGVDLKGENLEKYGDEVVLVADVIGTDSVKTSTELVDSGREIGVYEDQEVPVSKQTVLNKGVADGVDLEYQILKGLGLKEEIIIRDLEAYKKSCKEKECSLPLNEFVFDLKMDSDVELKEGWFTIDGQSTSMYYFVDSKGRYIAHFLPNFAIDNINNKTFDVNLKVEKGEDNNYRVKVTVNLDWLLSGERAFPIRIDPSIVHDDTADFSGGIFNGVESVTGPRIQIPVSSSTPSFDCTGGTVTTNGSYRVHKFTASGSLVCTGSGSVEVLVVAGGGGGGYWQYGGGGGAGGMVVHPNMSLSTASYTVTVGNGGAGSGTGAGGRGTAGQNSVFNGITANGGGGGGGYLNDATSQPPTTGGSGGGGAGGHTGAAATQGNSGGGTGYGYAGGNGNAGGGGGAGGAGGVGTCGIGRESSITGTATYYAGGGGGYGTNGCSGGGGNSGVAGTANTGGGGGSSAAGGSGVVIVSYIPTVEKINISGEYTSSSMDMASSMSGGTLSWIPSGVNTGNGETPYSTTGMVAQWNLNETSGTTAVSGGTCGASCNGTLTSMTTSGQDAAASTGWTADNKRWGAGALMFDGTNDYVTTSARDSTGYTAMSVETWIKTNSTASNIMAVQWKGLMLYINRFTTGKVFIGFDNLSTDNSASDESMTLVNDDQWHHIVGTNNGTVTNIYVDGVLEKTYSDTLVTGSQAIVFGSNAGASGFYKGVIDSTRIYSRVLSADEILSNYQAGNIEFQYRVSADNSTWSDWTSYSDDGALMFDGSNDYIVSTEGAPYLEVLSDFLSLEAWVKTSFVGNQTVVSYYNSVNGGNVPGFGIDVYSSSGNGLPECMFGLPTIAGGTNISDGQWHHIVCTYEEVGQSELELNLYVDGELENSTTSYDYITINESINLYIGTFYDNYYDTYSNYFRGTIDSVRIYSRALDPTEIADNYAIADGESPSDTTDMLAFWKLNALSGTNATSSGICGTSCDGTLTSFADTSGKDVTSNSGWTSNTKRGSDYAWEGFDNQYLYNINTSGLVGYWPMDEASGTSVADAKGSNTGTATSTIIQPGKFSNSRNFNGTSAYISLASRPITGSGSFSVFAWIKTSATGARREIFSTGTGSTNNDALYLFINASNYIEADLMNSAGPTSAVTVTDGNWHYVGVVNTAGTFQIYVDGKASGSSSAKTPNLGSTATIIGRSLGASYYFNGDIDELRVYNVALSASTVARDYILGSSAPSVLSNKPGSVKMEGTGSTQIISGQNVVDSNTVALWHLDETGGSGAYIKDSSASALHLTPAGTVYTKGGKIGGARTFSGSGHYIPISSGFSQINTLSISLWFKTSSTARQALFGQSSSAPTGAPGSYVPTLVIQTDGKIRAEYWTGAVGAITSTLAYNDGSWHHVAFVGSGTSQGLYIDGVSIGTRAGTIAQSWWTVTTIGAGYNNATRGGSDGWLYFNGLIDEVCVSKIARTADEVANAYRLGRDTFINKTVETRDLSSLSTLPIYIAGDRPGSYLNTMWGETGYSNYQADASTVGLWHLDEISGGGAYMKDSSGLNSHATPTGTTYTALGKLGSARSFNGTSDYASMSDTDALSFATSSSAFTISAWIYPTSLPASDKAIFTKYNSNAGRMEYFFGTYGDQLRVYINESGSASNYTETTTDASLALNTWQHVVATIDMSTDSIIFYKNSVKLNKSTSGTYPTDIPNLTEPPRIGSMICGAGTACNFWAGNIDEVQVSNVARTADEIRQAYEVGLRTHTVQIDFGASLVSGNLITGSGDTSFSVDATVYGLAELGSGLYVDEKVIVKENYDGTEYIAQGTVSAITASTGAVTVSSWDTGSTFPSAGYTVGADVFKWQREYIPVKNRTVSTHVNAINLLSFYVTNGDEGRNIWIDDLKSTSGYLSTYIGEELTFPSSGRYFQYKAIFNTWDMAVTPYISQVQLDYGPNGPTMDQIMRHGKWFSGGAEQPFWWVNPP